MPRIARVVIEGLPHHITQRGNNKQDVFFVDDDRRTYLEILKRQSTKYDLTIMGYCLMPNHIHLIATPQNADSLANAIGRTHFIYTQYINSLHNRSGHLWQCRFYSCVLDEYHFLAAMRYIERNPVRAGMCRTPWAYEWSSAENHINVSGKSDVLDLSGWRKIVRPTEWEKLLAEDVDNQEIKKLRSNTFSGRPLGSDSFISKLERIAGCRLRPLPVGRPKRKRDAEGTKK